MLQAACDGLTDAGILADDSGLTPMPPEMLVDADCPRVVIEVRPC